MWYKVLLENPVIRPDSDKKHDNTVNVFYDLETVLKDNEFHVYQIGYKVEGEDVNPTILTGWDWMLWFVQELRNISAWKDAQVRLISFNGSRFDDIFLFWECLETGIFCNAIFQNNCILSLTIGKDVKCWDLARFLTMGGLEWNCKAFKTVN